MRVHGFVTRPVVRTGEGQRPIVIQAGSLRLSLTTTEARALADALHDHIDSKENHP